MGFLCKYGTGDRLFFWSWLSKKDETIENFLKNYNIIMSEKEKNIMSFKWAVM